MPDPMPDLSLKNIVDRICAGIRGEHEAGRLGLPDGAYTDDGTFTEADADRVVENGVRGATAEIRRPTFR